MVLVNKNTAAEVLAAVYDEENDAIRTTATIDGSDIQLGAIELKDGATEARAKVGAVNELVATDTGLPVASYPVASEVHTGQVGGHSAVPAATAFTLDTSAYSIGDVLTDTLEIDNMVRVNDGTGIFTSVTLIDEDDQGVAMTLVVLDANVSLGTKNSAPSISAKPQPLPADLAVKPILQQNSLHPSNLSKNDPAWLHLLGTSALK